MLSTTQFELIRPEGARRYLLAEGRSNDQRPLILILHPHTGSAAQVFGQTAYNSGMAVWLDIAEREGLVVIAPDGERGSDKQRGWNDCRADAPTNPDCDDVGFLSALIDHAISAHRVDPRRVYVIGMSNGGAMAYRLAHEIGDRLAAISVVAALMPTRTKCAPPAKPISVQLILGTADEITPYEGGEVGHRNLGMRGSAISTMETVRIWRELAGLPETGHSASFRHLDPLDPTRASKTTWGDDPAALQVSLITIDGGGHVEPSPTRRAPKMFIKMLGLQNGDVETAEEAWQFFRQKKSRS
jgi:polyhydroxybutyrate depolymerase